MGRNGTFRGGGHVWHNAWNFISQYFWECITFLNQKVPFTFIYFMYQFALLFYISALKLKSMETGRVRKKRFTILKQNYYSSVQSTPRLTPITAKMTLEPLTFLNRGEIKNHYICVSTLSYQLRWFQIAWQLVEACGQKRETGKHTHTRTHRRNAER